MKTHIHDLIESALATLKQQGVIAQDVSYTVQIERTREQKHGDFASNIALALAKSAKMNPRQLAQQIGDCLEPNDFVDKVEIAGPGFINFYINQTAHFAVIPKVLQQAESYGDSSLGRGVRVLQEFVSANPTGPLHVGHGRGAVFGSALASLLRKAGFDVDCEYYVNDAGRQMDILAVSVWLRYLECGGVKIQFPKNAYHGDYVKEIALKLFGECKDRLVMTSDNIFDNLPLDEEHGGDKEIYIDALIERAKSMLGKDNYALLHQFGLQEILQDIRQDLAEFKVNFEHWFSEKSLFNSGAIDKGLDALQSEGHTYIQQGALWFNATAFGDEKDRVLKRANGQTTYFASDVAYHWDKYERGYDRVIDIFGADHHGYIPRVKAVVKALGKDPEALHVELVQFAILYRGTERVQMSTRSGSFITMRQLREEVGTDAARFFYVSRKAEQHMDFDLELAKSQTVDNPVYYIQYAHARICSVMRQLTEQNILWDNQLGCANLSLLTSEHEQTLIRLLQRFPDMIESAARQYEPHQVAYFLRELANALHSYYNAQKFIVEDASIRNARLCLIMAVKQVLINGLDVLGVSAPEQM